MPKNIVFLFLRSWYGKKAFGRVYHEWNVENNLVLVMEIYTNTLTLCEFSVRNFIVVFMPTAHHSAITFFFYSKVHNILLVFLIT